MFDLAQAAVEGALVAGARYADARAVLARYETMSARNGDVEDLVQRESVGVGVRALVDSSWGFFAVPDPTGLSARQSGRMATDLARCAHFTSMRRRCLPCSFGSRRCSTPSVRVASMPSPLTWSGSVTS
jgi:TldD protein